VPFSRFDDASGIACRAQIDTSHGSLRLVTKGSGTSATCLFLFFMLLLGSGCTLDDGEPWGFVDADMAVAEPSVGADFEVDSFELEVETVRLITTSAAGSSFGDGAGGEFDPQNPPVGCSLCHGGHCHCDGELVSYEDLRERVASGEAATRNVVANIAPAEAITTSGTVALGQASVGDRTSVDTVEVQLSGLRIDGTLTRDGEQFPTTLSLPGIAGMTWSGPAAMSVGPDSPEIQQILVTLEWQDAWLDAIDLAQLQTDGDGQILIASTSNRDQAQLLAGQVAESSIEVEVLEE
jgi:hypothetical protein